LLGELPKMPTTQVAPLISHEPPKLLKTVGADTELATATRTRAPRCRRLSQLSHELIGRCGL